MEELLRKYQRLLQLQDWDIDICQTSVTSSEAMTKIIFNDYKASILIRENLSDEEKEKCIIHELIHLIFRDAYDIFTETVKDEFAKEYCERQHERAIEKTSKIIYSLLNTVK
jgi:hypothetical protein